ncbi:hypothetical protein [Streptomyces sp. Ncost-T10-10d]|uniref:hypothetical protein n=1 Tax=Streptomyces sp. Ncost-T10-10d TaxID=1839774 RepID=UPI00081EB430|nr:hypothetical protein [Streptomyces sp. Ncost-T10-10d]SCF56513.1 hypothetical protein GA0115254_100723 [Streptomyces sp. Ncost-T10-10d]
MSRLGRTAATLAAASGLFAGGIATAPSAAAADCWTPAQFGHNQWAHTGNNPISHNGPYAGCTSYPVGDSWVSVMCKYTNTAGSIWYYTDWGWIYGAKYLSFPYGGVTVTCTKY